MGGGKKGWSAQRVVRCGWWKEGVALSKDGGRLEQRPKRKRVICAKVTREPELLSQMVIHGVK